MRLINNDKKPDQASAATIAALASLMSNLVETVCEHEHDLSLMRLVNLMELYRVYLELASNEHNSDLYNYAASMSNPSNSVLTQHLGDTQMVSFERFVRDSRMLGIAAAAAARETADSVVAPAPLSLSANDQ